MKILTALVVSSLMAVGTGAFAQDDDALRRTVHYGDLNLASASGRTQFKARLEAAVGAVCPNSAFVGLAGQNERSLCLSTARTDLDARMNRAVAAAAPGPQLLAEAAFGH